MTFLKLNPTFIGTIQLAIGAAMGIGGLITYSEAKFASRESVQSVNMKVDFEHEQRRIDVERIEKAIQAQNEKLDRIWGAISRGR